MQNHFDQRLTEIDREGTFSLPELVTDHQVTGTKIDYRIQHATHTYPKIEILTRSSSGDVDIPVILTGLFGSSRISMAVYKETGKHLKPIRINSSSLSDIQCKAIVGFHAFSDNDYISSLFTKNKENVGQDEK